MRVHSRPADRAGKSFDAIGDWAPLEPLESRLLLSGTTYVVDSLSDVFAVDGLVTLREAIIAANANAPTNDALAGSADEVDEITFDPALAGGTITLTAGQLEITDSLAVTGLGSKQLTVEGSDEGRVLRIDGDQTVVELAGLTLTGGLADVGGGIYVDESDVTLTDVHVIENTAEKGGGIYNNAGRLVLDESEIRGNIATELNGGGMFNAGGDVLLMNSTVKLNAARTSLTTDELLSSPRCFILGSPRGGGICNEGTLTVVGSTVSQNNAYIGGGVYNKGQLSVLDSTFHWNTTVFNGGAIANGDVTLVNTTVAGNQAGWDGGACIARAWCCTTVLWL